jgi:two-component system, chemotaxis family, chemotaxis protein CheY
MEVIMKILIVDDSKAMRMIVARTLRQAGYGDATLVEAGNGREALSAIETSQPNLVLCDWNMPEMSGIELLRALRSANNPIPFGFVTSEASQEMKDTAAAAGALFLITKPFTPKVFEETIGSMGA